MAESGKLLARKQVPNYVKEKFGVDLPYRSIEKHASLGTGPEYQLFGGVAYYQPPKVDAWVIDRMGPPTVGSWVAE